MINTSSNIGPLLGLFLALVPFVPVAAEGPVIRSGDSVSVESNQVLEGDFYALGQSITLSGAAEKDVYAAGMAVTVNAPVTEDLVVAGGDIEVHGAIGDDVRIMGGEVIIADPVADDVVVLGGVVRILSTASVGGDLIFFGGEVVIDGPVEGTVYGTADSIRIDSYVGGDVSVRVGTGLTLGDRTEIAGNVTYKSATDLTRAQGAVVTGTITRDGSLFETEESDPVRPLVLNLLVLIFSGLTIFFILRTRTAKFMTILEEGYGRLGLIGLGMFLAIPIVSIILMASVIGFIVGFVLFLGYGALLLISFMCLPVLFGVVFQRLIRLGSTVTVFTVILGVFVMVALAFVPVLGFFTLFLGFLMILGALYSELYRFFKAV
jgi:hypothetical protein